MNRTELETRAAGAVLNYEVGQTKFRGLYFASTGARSQTAVMIVPDWRGLSPFVQTQAHGFAEAGHDVAIVDLYGEGLYASHESQASSLIKALIDNRADGVARMQACLAAFRTRIGDSVNVIVLAYSIGGMVSLDFARSRPALAGVVLCSALLKAAASGGPIEIPFPVLALHGTQDVVCPMTAVQELVAEMDRARNDFRIVLYGRTHHAFYNPEAGTDETARLVYSESSDRAARQEIERFLKLKGES
jgi:dienelactone hydrolase